MQLCTEWKYLRDNSDSFEITNSSITIIYRLLKQLTINVIDRLIITVCMFIKFWFMNVSTLMFFIYEH